MAYGFLLNGPAMHFSIAQLSTKKFLKTMTFFSMASISSFYLFNSQIESKTV
jgi:hypothetical protein